MDSPLQNLLNGGVQILTQISQLLLYCLMWFRRSQMVKSTSCNHVAYNLKSPFLDAVISEASCVTCMVVEAKVRTQFAIEA